MADMAHHYREPIFRLMSERLSCHFYFGDKVSTVKEIAVSDLPGFQRHLTYISLPGGFHYLKGAVRASLKYKKIVLLGDPHGVHNWIICILGRVLGREVYLWTHGWYGKESMVRSVFKKLFFRISSKLLVYGNRSKKLLISNGFKERNISVVYNSLNYNYQVCLRSNNVDFNFFSEHFKNNDPIILYVGRVQKIKRLDLIIDAMKVLNESGCPVNFVLVGGLDSDESLQGLVEKYELGDKVWFYGPCYDEAVLCKIISSADVCVSPGNVGLTAIHAMTYGCPVITHNDFSKQMPEFEAIVPGKTGDFFIYGDVSDLVSKIRFWIDKSRQSKSSVAEECYSEISQRWNPGVQIERIFEALETGND